MKKTQIKTHTPRRIFDPTKMRIMVVNEKDDNESVPFTSFVVVNKFVTLLVVEVEEGVLLCVLEEVGEALGVVEEVRVGEELGVGGGFFKRVISLSDKDRL